MLVLQGPRGSDTRADGNVYPALLAGFEEAHRNIKSASDNLSAILAEISAGPADGERSALIAGAARSCEDARQACMIAASQLQEFLIAETVSSSPVLPEGLPGPRTRLA